MKKVLFTSLTLGILSIILLSCKEDILETCERDEICQAKEVSYCCELNNCVYKYNGNEYADTDDGYNQLLADLGCSTAKSLKSTDGDCTNEEIIAKLQQLKAKVKGTLE